MKAAQVSTHRSHERVSGSAALRAMDKGPRFECDPRWLEADIASLKVDVSDRILAFGRGVKMKLFVFGLGYAASHILLRLRSAGTEVTATVRTSARAEELARPGITLRRFPSETDRLIAEDIGSSDAILSSVPPSQRGDPVLASFAGPIAKAANRGWVGYLSTVGVYGDHLGNWVDETTPTMPSTERSQRRIAAEREWLAIGAHVFRLSGIYGPGRNQLVNLAAGTARRIFKPRQVFNRIHVADVAAVIEASLRRPRRGGIYNVSDDEPAPPQDVVEFAARLCGVEPPAEMPYERAKLSPMARSFYAENKRVRNDLIRSELGVDLQYPSFREGLVALRALGDGPTDASPGPEADRVG